MFSHRKEREELLEALSVRDDDFTPYHYHQVGWYIVVEQDLISMEHMLTNLCFEKTMNSSFDPMLQYLLISFGTK